MQASILGKKYSSIFILLIGLGLTSFIAYLQLESRKQQYFRSLEDVSSSTAQLISTNMKGRIQALIRMARRFEKSKGANKALWLADAKNYYDDQPGYQAIEWVDKEYNVKWIYPNIGNEKVIGVNLAFEEFRKKALEEARDNKEVYFSEPVELIQGGLGFLAFIPIYYDSEFSGFIVAVFKYEDLLSGIIQAAENKDIAFSLFSDQKELYNQNYKKKYFSNNSTFSFDEIKIYGIKWKVILESSYDYLVIWSGIVELVLFGIFLSLLAGYIVYQQRQILIEGIKAKDAELRLEIALEASNIGLWDWNSKTNETYFNSTWYTMLGYENGELPMCLDTWKELCHPEDIDAALSDVQKYLNNETEIYSNEHRLRKKDGTWIWIRDVGKIIEWENGSPLRLVGFHIDIDHLKNQENILVRARNQAIEASKFKSEFLANMSHEIRTPMNGVIGMTNLLLETKLSEDQKDLANTVRHSATSLLAIINDILDFSKIEAGKLEIVSKDFSLVEFLNYIEKVNNFRFEEKNITFILEQSEYLPEFLLGDEDRLRQIITNLIGNAVKFTDNNGAILFKIDLEEEREENIILQFSVIDTGIGIQKEKQRQIFDAFSQADENTYSKYGGTGLGLSISSKLVELMGGKLKLSSEAGSGTVFFFTVNFKKSSLKKVAVVEDKTTLNTYTPQKILLVEDNKVNQKLAIRLLEKAGHSVMLAENGKEAVNMAKSGDMDIILMDIQMPILSGDQATIEIRKEEALRTVPIIALTAHALKSEEEYYISCGMSAYITKPLDKLELLNTIEKFCRK